MKKLLVLLTVVALALATVTPVFAMGKGPGGRQSYGNGVPPRTEQHQPRSTFTITGTIAEVGADYVTVNVLHGNKLTQPYIETQIKLALTVSTRYLLTNGTSAVPITLADLEVGQEVSVLGILADQTWTAWRITVGAALNCLP